MLVHFVASKSNLEHEGTYYQQILDEVAKGGHTLTQDWLKSALEIISDKERSFSELDWEKVYKDNMEAMAKTDLVIAEVTARSFSVGFQVAMALQQKKPVLLLQRRAKSSSFYPASARDNLLLHKFYDESTLGKIVHDFLEENRIDNKDMRFNFFIDRQIYNYLRWVAFKTGKTKAEILRELVKHEIDKQEFKP